MENKRSQWTSNFGFLMAAIGSAVGLGNLWGFPYKMGANGGFVFLIIYLILVLFCGVVVMTLEMTIGRKTGKSPVFAFVTLGKKYKIIGILSVMCPVLIMGFYSVLLGWVIRYIIGFAMEFLGLKNFTVSGGEAYFNIVTTDIVGSLLYAFISFVISAIIVMGGISKGIEKFSKPAMISLVIMLLIVIAKSLSMPGSMEGIKFMFSFSTEEFNLFATIRAAGGQMLFSLSLGLGILIAYGSYLSKEINIVKSVAIIAVSDTLIAIMAGLAIFPALFSLGMQPNGGVGLLFITLHNVFMSMGAFGAMFGVIFYLLVLIAGLTTTVALIEVVVSHFNDSREANGKKPNRKIVVIGVCALMFTLSIPVCFDMLGKGSLPQPLGLNWLDFYDFIAEGVVMPLVAILICLVAGWGIGVKAIEDEITLEGNKFYLRKTFYICIKYITPALLIFVLVSVALSFFGL